MTQKPAAKNWQHWLREIGLTLGALVGLVCVLAAIGAVFFGLSPVIFRSGSMAPAIDTGALAIAQNVPVHEVHSGDVVSVQNSDGERVTHRVVAVQSLNPNEAMLTLKGDANPQPDLQSYQVSKVDRVLFSVPGIGYLVAWLQSPWVIFLGGLLVGVLLTLAFRPTRRKAAEEPVEPTTLIEPSDSPPGSEADESADKPAGQRLGRALSLLVAGALLATGLAAGGVRDTMASFQDTAAAASGTFSSATLPQPTPNPPNCAASGIPSTAQVSWNAATLPSGAQFRLRYSGLINGTVLLGSATSYTFQGSLLGGLGLGSGRLNVDVDTIISGTNWVSPVASRTIGYSITVVIASFTC